MCVIWAGATPSSEAACREVSPAASRSLRNSVANHI
ncbi:hypothetical protein SUDANB130_04243 [Streptomyces sp. enrichment culture]